MRTVKPGDRIKDNDPRVSERVLTVVEVGETHARCRHRGYPAFKEVRVRLDRIKTDGKPRRYGFNLLSDGTERT